jgi:hypothetical protein
MALILLDTSVASLFLPHRSRSPVRALYEPPLIGNTLALSFISPTPVLSEAAFAAEIGQ